MTALEQELLTLDEARGILRDPTRNKAYLRTRLGPDVRDFLAWKRLSNASDRTLDTYERILARFAVSLPAGVGIADVSVEHVMLYFEPVPRDSWRLHRSCLNGLFKWASKPAVARRTAINPVDVLPELLKQNRTPVFPVFSEAEQHALIGASRLMDDPLRDRVRVLILLYTGIRKLEARRLRVADVDVDGRCILVRRGKGDKARIVNVDGPLWQAWEDARSEFAPLPRVNEFDGEDWVAAPDRGWRLTDHVWFPMRVAGAYLNRPRQVTASYPERMMSERGMHEWWGRLVKHSGIEYRSMHKARHTYATDALDATEGDLYGVSEQLGHSSTTITETYLHSSKRRRQSVADKLARARRLEDQ